MGARISLVKFLQRVYALRKGAVRESNKALQSAQDSLSETERERRTGLKQKIEVKLKAVSSSSNSETSDAEEGYKRDRRHRRLERKPAGDRRIRKGEEREWRCYCAGQERPMASGLWSHYTNGSSCCEAICPAHELWCRLLLH